MGRVTVIKEQAAEGGMATISQIRAEDDGCLYALKRPKNRDARTLEMFYRELELTAECAHPNVIGVRRDLSSSGPEDDSHQMALEWIEGEELFVLFKQHRGGRVPPREAVAITLQLLYALEAVHGQGVLHCDIRPQNLLIDRANRLKLIDFGLARRKKEVGRVPFAVAGGNLFVSPEHADPGSLCEQSDIYCVGLILFFLLTGSFPVKYQGLGNRNVQSMSRLLRTATPHAPAELCGDLPGELSDAVHKAIQPVVGDRYASATQFIERLEYIAGHLPEMLAHTPSASATVSSREAKAYRLSNKDMGLSDDHMMILWLGAGTLLVMVLLVLVILIVMRKDPGVASLPPALDRAMHQVITHKQRQNWEAARSSALDARRHLSEVQDFGQRGRIQNDIVERLQTIFYAQFSAEMEKGDEARERAPERAIDHYVKANELRRRFERDVPGMNMAPGVLNDPDARIRACWESIIANSDDPDALGRMMDRVPENLRDLVRERIVEVTPVEPQEDALARVDVASPAAPAPQPAAASPESQRADSAALQLVRLNDITRQAVRVRDSSRLNELIRQLEEEKDTSDDLGNQDLFAEAVLSLWRKYIELEKGTVGNLRLEELRGYIDQAVRDLPPLFSSSVMSREFRDALAPAIRERGRVLAGQFIDEQKRAVSRAQRTEDLNSIRNALSEAGRRYGDFLTSEMRGDLETTLSQRQTVLNNEAARAQRDREAAQRKQERISAARSALNQIKGEIEAATTGRRRLTQEAVNIVVERVDRVLQEYSDVESDLRNLAREVKSLARARVVSQGRYRPPT